MKRLLVVLLLALLLVSGNVIAQDDDDPQEGGTLRYGIQAVTAFDPVFIADTPSFNISSLMYNTLVSLWVNPDGSREPMPSLAESWEFSEDGTTVTFNLRQGMMFHDGNAVFAEGESREVVADDVVYSFTRSLETEGSSAATSDLLAVFESVEAIDDYTVQLNLSAPNGLLFEGARGISSIVVYPREAIEQLGEDFATNPVGTGPFEFVEYVPDDRVVLQRNEDYYIRPLLDEVVFQIIPDNTARIIALETGDLDIAETIPDPDIPRLQDDPNYIVEDLRCPVSQQFTFNLAVEEFQDIRLRQAIAFAFDGNAIGRVTRPGAHIDACGTAGPGVPGYNEGLCDLFEYNPDQTAELLGELGYEDTDGNGIFDLDGEDLNIPIMVWNLPEMPRVAEAMVSQLNDSGIGTSLEVVEFGTWIDNFFAAEPYLFGWTGFCGAGGTTDFWGPNSNFAGSMSIEIPEGQEFLSQSSQFIDPEERGALVLEGAEIIYAEYVSLPAGFFDAYFAYNTRVQDMPLLGWWFNLVTERSNTWVQQ